MNKQSLMIKAIEEGAVATAHSTGVSKISKPVLAALSQVPRQDFVPKELKESAYLNEALPIGHGQTISQPFVVALMTELLGVKKNDVVLEIGTGSGYQAAVLSQLVKQVYSVEVVPTLGIVASERLRRLGYSNVTVRLGDGHEGLPEFGLYDGIIVTAVAKEIPEQLIDQLKPGKNMVIPIGDPSGAQMLTLVHKTKDGEIVTTDILPVRFVPLINSD